VVCRADMLARRALVPMFSRLVMMVFSVFQSAKRGGRLRTHA